MERAQIAEPFKQKANKNKSRTYKGFTKTSSADEGQSKM